MANGRLHCLEQSAPLPVTVAALSTNFQINMPKEFITHKSDNLEAWLCHCGNSPESDGFYPCNANGIEVDPNALQG